MRLIHRAGSANPAIETLCICDRASLGVKFSLKVNVQCLHDNVVTFADAWSTPACDKFARIF